MANVPTATPSYGRFTGNSNVVAVGVNKAPAPKLGTYTGGSNTSLPNIGARGIAPAAGVDPQVAAYLHALAAANATPTAGSGSGSGSSGGSSSGGTIGAAPPAAGSGNPIIDALNAQLAASKQAQTDSVNTQNANAGASGNRINAGTTALQAQLTALRAQQAQSNATTGQNVATDYHQAQQALTGQTTGITNDLTAQGFSASPVAAQVQSQQANLTDQNARQAALQATLAQNSDNTFQAKAANATAYGTGSLASLEANRAKNVGLVNLNATNQQNKISDAIAQQEMAQQAAQAAAASGGGKGGRGGRGGGGGSSSGGGAAADGMLAPGDVGNSVLFSNLANNDVTNGANNDYWARVANLTNGVDPKSAYGKNIAQVQSALQGGMSLADVQKAWSKQQSSITSQRQLAASGRTNNQGQPLGNANATAGFAWHLKNQALAQLANAYATAHQAAGQKTGLSGFGQAAPVVQQTVKRKGR